jgi:fatty acid desaturase
MRRRRPSPLTRADLVVIWGGFACLLGGIVLLALAWSFAATLVAICLLGLAGIAIVSLLFLLVGESEDRDYGERLR